MTLAESNKRKKHILPRNQVFKNFLIDDDYYSTKNRSLSCGGHCIVEGQAFDLGAQWFDNHFDIVKDKCVAVIDRENKKVVVNTSRKAWYDVFFEARKEGYEIFRTIGTIPDWNLSLPLAIDWVLREHSKWLIREFTNRWIVPVKQLMRKEKNTIWFDIDTCWKCTKEEPNNNILKFIKKYKINKKIFYNQQLFDPFVEGEYPTLEDIVKKKVFNRTQVDVVAKRKFYSEYCLGWGVVPWKDVDKYFYMPFDKAYFEAMCRKTNIWFQTDQIASFTTWKDGVIAMRDAMVKGIEKYNERLHKKCAENMNNAFYKGIEDLIERGVYQKLLNTGSTGGYYSTQEYIGYQYGGSNKCVDKEAVRRVMVRQPYHTYKLWYWDGKIHCQNESIHINKAKQFWPEIKKAIDFWCPQKVGEGRSITVPPRFENITHTFSIGVHEKTSWYGRPLGGLDTFITLAGTKFWLSDFIEFVKYYRYENIFDIRFNPKAVIYDRDK